MFSLIKIPIDIEIDRLKPYWGNIVKKVSKYMYMEEDLAQLIWLVLSWISDNYEKYENMLICREWDINYFDNFLPIHFSDSNMK